MARTPVYEYAISLPFRFDDFGNIASTTAQTKIWADRVRSAVGTSLAERVVRPDYGTQIPENLFENVTLVSELIQNEVAKVFENNLVELELDETVVTIDEQAGTVYAEVLYFLPNKEQTSVTIGIASISPDAPIQEELL
jgi:phage baseplate assembly protein W